MTRGAGDRSGQFSKQSAASDAIAWCVAHPSLVIVGWIAIVGIALTGVARLQVDTATSSFLDRSSEAWVDYQRSVELFGGDEFLTIVVTGDDPFSKDALSRLADITARLRESQGVRRVDSASTYPLMIAAGLAQGFSFAPITAGTGSRSTAALHRSVLSDPIAPGILVSRDARSFAVNAILDGDIEGPRADLVFEIADVLDGSDSIISGVPIFRTRVNERTASELALLVPLTIAVLTALVLIAFRSSVAVLANLSCAVVGTFVALGAMGGMSIPLSLATMTLPPILLALGAAYSTHVIGGMRDPYCDVACAFRSKGGTIALSGITTAFGFLAMAAVPVDAIRQLGTVGAIGTIAVSAASLSLAPVLLSRRALSRRGAYESVGKAASRIVLRVIRWPRSVVCIWILSAGIIGGGISQLEIDTDIIRWFPPQDPIRRDYETIRRTFSGITPMNVMLESQDDQTITTPENLRAVAELVAYLESKDEVGRAVGVTGPLRRVNEAFAGGADLPASKMLAEQYLGLLSGIDLVANLVTEDRMATNILIRLDVNGSRQLIRIGDEIDKWWDRNGVNSIRATATGIMFEFARAQQAIAIGQIRGLLVAFLAIAAALTLVLRSARGSVLALVPNVVPVLVVFGLIGWLEVALDAASACVGAVALGIAVDDTMHVAATYRDFRDEGFDARVAMAAAIESVCPALIWTTGMISLGFASLGLSSFVMVSHFGLITSGMVLLCLLADTSLLPVLLVWKDSREERMKMTDL